MGRKKAAKKFAIRWDCVTRAMDVIRIIQRSCDRRGESGGRDENKRSSNGRRPRRHDALSRKRAFDAAFTACEGRRLTNEKPPCGVSAHEASINEVRTMSYELPQLPYAYNALEPVIDEQTMRLHHDKHHAAYVKGLNQAEEMLIAARKSGDYALVKHWEREAAFNGSGHVLHNLFWTNLSPEGGGEPASKLADGIRKEWGSFETFKREFSAAAKAVEGGGWGILAYNNSLRRLLVLQAEKHQNLTIWGSVPLLVVDVWEHAYYLKYQNNRGEYVDNLFKIFNWKEVESRYLAATT